MIFMYDDITKYDNDCPDKSFLICYNTRQGNKPEKQTTKETTKMSINWNNVIQDQARGMDLTSAFYKEDRRRRRNAAEQAEKRRRANQERKRSR